MEASVPTVAATASIPLTSYNDNETIVEKSPTRQVVDSEQKNPTASGDVEVNSSRDRSVDNVPPVDWGLRPWLVVLGAWCVSFCSYGWINSELYLNPPPLVHPLTDIHSFHLLGMGAIQEYYETGPLQQYSPSQIAWIPALQIYFMSALGPVTGRIIDRNGPRLLLAIGSVMHVFGLMMASVSSEYYQFLLSQGVCSALGAAATFLACITSITGWFDKRRGLAFGVLATGSSLGGVVFPLMLGKLIETVGYGWAIRAVAFVIAALLIVANLTVRARMKPTPVKFSMKNLAQPFRELPYVVLVMGLALIPFGLYVPITYLPTVSVWSGTSESQARNLVAFYNAARYVISRRHLVS
jgi:MFS family permease